MPQESFRIKQLNVEIFGGCNYKCRICPQSIGREPEFLKKLDYDLFVKIVMDASQYGLEAVSFHGSGEPTLNPELVRMVKFVSERKYFSSFFTNGARLTPDLFTRLIDAGIKLIRISLYGYDRESYYKWSRQDKFDLVLENYFDCRNILKDRGLPLEILQTWHAIYDLNNKEGELRKCIELVEKMGAKSEIWLLHNWTGIYKDAPYERVNLAETPIKRSCGRPFAPALEVRAGGLGNHKAAVVACPYVLGRDSEAVMGHLDTQSIAEVVKGGSYQNLRRAHMEGRFEDMSYCSNCDQLYDLTESLVWTNIEGRFYGQSKTSSVVYTDYSDPK